jgi:hypothetical protein
MRYLVIIILFINTGFLTAQLLDSNLSDEKPYSITIEALGGASYNLEGDNFNSKKLNFSPIFQADVEA